MTATEDSSLAISVYASDPDSALFGDRVRYRLIPGATWLSVDSLTGLLSGTPRIADLNDTLFTVIAIDDSGATDIVTFSIPVLHVNHPPIFSSTPVVHAAKHPCIESGPRN